MDLSTLLDDVFIVAGVFFALAFFFAGLAFVVNVLLRFAVRFPALERLDVGRAQRLVRAGLLTLFLLSTAAIVIFSVTVLAQGRDLRIATVELLTTALPPGFWQRLGIGLALTVGLAVLARYGLQLFERLLPRTRSLISTNESIRISDERLDFFLRLVRQTIHIGAWLLVVITGARLVGFPEAVGANLLVALRIFLIVQVGRMLVGLLGAIINTLDALSETYLRSRQLDQFYDLLRTLLPLASQALQFIIYVQAATLAITQIEPLANLATFGVRATQVIGIFFLGRVVIELLKLLVDLFFLVRGNLSDAQWQQRLTFGPLLKNAATYAVIFGGSLLILSILGFDIGPILVGLGGLSLIVGLAAQPVTTDLISGLFILFENLFLVGDYIETRDARGIVESIDVRTTRIRDPDGQLHLVRNGQIGSIVNYSKGYVYAVVLVPVTYDADLKRAFRLIEAIGREINEQFDDVLEPTFTQGIEEFGEQTLSIRTLTRVKPGRHHAMAREIRRAIKDAFDEAGIALCFNEPVLYAAPNVVLSDRELGTKSAGEAGQSASRPARPPEPRRAD
ncbi:MAG: mechanosensitive ion channel family protein [Oscillochloridaceae bacterium]|nr:mechanosensitive ion channel family protein [Chloroflexaceae bacterium]MDW8389549.1 mechanosensitive ion channel family protein [Oscillochloridaceae bacterium]